MTANQGSFIHTLLVVAGLGVACGTPSSTPGSAAEPARPSVPQTEARGPETPATAAPATAPAAQASAQAPANAPASDPYPYYKALDLTRVPFHRGRGEWGAWQPIQAPAKPVIKDEVTISSGQEFERVRKNNRRIIVPAGVTVPAVGLHDFDDVEIEIRDGAVISMLYLGNNERLYIHGARPGIRSSGRLDELDAGYTGPVTDLIIDGLDSVPPGYTRCFLIGTTHSLTRVSITNMRVFGGLGLWDGGASDVVIAGCNMWNSSGAWFWRLDGALDAKYNRLVMFRNYLVTKGQPVLRLHRSTTLWVGENTWVNSTQFDPESTGYVARLGPGKSSAVWFEDGRVHSQGHLGTEFTPSPGDLPYWRVKDTTVVTDSEWTRGNSPGAGDDWVVDAKVVKIATNPLPPWTERNRSGDPRELATKAKPAPAPQ